MKSRLSVLPLRFSFRTSSSLSWFSQRYCKAGKRLPLRADPLVPEVKAFEEPVSGPGTRVRGAPAQTNYQWFGTMSAGLIRLYPRVEQQVPPLRWTETHVPKLKQSRRVNDPLIYMPYHVERKGLPCPLVAARKLLFPQGSRCSS